MYQLGLARSGESLFKVRGNFLLGVIVVGGLVAYFGGTLGPFESDGANLAWCWVSFAVAVAGALVRIVTSGYAALGTSGVNKDKAVAAELNTSGPYSLVRNPLYFGRILNFTGVAMLSGSWVYGVITLLLSILVYERISAYEEEFLRKEFGEAHAKWAHDVPFLMPRLHGWSKPKYPFWTRRCIKREDKKIFMLFSAVVVCDVARGGLNLIQLPEQRAWFGAWALVTAAYLVTRSLRHFTKTFEGIS